MSGLRAIRPGAILRNRVGITISTMHVAGVSEEGEVYHWFQHRDITFTVLEVHPAVIVGLLTNGRVDRIPIIPTAFDDHFEVLHP